MQVRREVERVVWMNSTEVGEARRIALQFGIDAAGRLDLASSRESAMRIAGPDGSHLVGVDLHSIEPSRSFIPTGFFGAARSSIAWAFALNDARVLSLAQVRFSPERKSTGVNRENKRQRLAILSVP